MARQLIWAWYYKPARAEWLITLNSKDFNPVQLDLPGRSTVGAAFDGICPRYDEHAVLEREVASRLLERLELRPFEPGRILDLGCGTGVDAAALKRKYRHSEVLGLDASLAMCQKLRRASGFLRPLRAVCGDISRLPLADRSVDLLWSNLALQWSADFLALTTEFRRILRPGGLLLFSTLGPESLREFGFLEGDKQPESQIRQFTDLRDIGNALQAAGFADPVMDSEFITMEYRNWESLRADLEWTGVNTHFCNWQQWADPATGLPQAYDNLRREDRLPLTWEIVYGAAFGPAQGQPIKTPEGDVAAFSVDSLRGSRARE